MSGTRGGRLAYGASDGTATPGTSPFKRGRRRATIGPGIGHQTDPSGALDLQPRTDSEDRLARMEAQQSKVPRKGQHAS